MAVGSADRAAWFASTWLITLSIVAGLAAVELLARTLDSDLARVGRSLYLAGSALGLASTTYDLAVTSTLLGAPRLPGWYFGVQHWADGLSTAYFALLAPAAMGCLGLAILPTRLLPKMDRIRLPGRDGPAAGPVRRIPRRIAVPAISRVHRHRHRGAGPPGADSAATAGHRGHTGPGQAFRTSLHRRR
jgi:hypothetical protein